MKAVSVLGIYESKFAVTLNLNGFQDFLEGTNQLLVTSLIILFIYISRL